MPEPSLGELTNIPADASLGQAGMTDFVPTMHEVNQQIFEAAKAKAQNDWNKYLQFLQNFREFTKDANEISKMEVAQPDREYLQNELKDIFSTIDKDPKNALAGNKMYEVQSRLQKLASQSTQSKQDRAFDEANRKMVVLYPNFNTDGNKNKINSFLGNKLGARELYTLDAPAPEFDASKLFGDLLKSSTAQYENFEYNPTDDKGQLIEGMMKTTTGQKVNPKTIQGLWNLAMDGSPDLAAAVKARYQALPEAIRKHYDANGGPSKYFEDLGASHIGAYFTPGRFKQKGEDYILTEKSDLSNNPNYMAAEKLAADLKKHKDEMGLNWYKATHPPATAKQDEKQPDDLGNIIYGINGDVPGTTMQLRDGSIVDKDSGNVMPVTGEFNVPASYFDNSIFTEYNKYAGAQRTKKMPDGTIVVDESVSPSRLFENDGSKSRTVKFVNGVVVGIKTDKGDWATDEQFKYITNQANIRHIKKYQKQVDISGGNKTEGAPIAKPVETKGKEVKGKTGKKIIIPD